MVTHYQCSKSLEEKPLLVQNTQQEKKTASDIAVHAPPNSK